MRSPEATGLDLAAARDALLAVASLVAEHARDAHGRDWCEQECDRLAGYLLHALGCRGAALDEAARWRDCFDADCKDPSCPHGLPGRVATVRV